MTRSKQTMHLQLFGGELMSSTWFSLNYWTKFLVLRKTCKVECGLQKGFTLR